MNLWFLDFETYFSNDYSLSRSDTTTESYIRDPRFRGHGVGWRDPAGNYGWTTHDDLPGFFASIDWAQTGVGAHHLHFDGLILSHQYNVRPAFLCCTKAMGNLVLPNHSKRLDSLATFYGLPNKTVPYNLFRGLRVLPPHIEREVAAGCLHDVELNFEIFRYMMAGAKNLPPFPPSELPIIDQTIRLFTEPVLHIDVPRARALADRIALEKETVLERLGLDGDVLASRECFAELLREMGVEPPMKASAATGEMTYAFAKNDAGMKELLESEEPDVAALAAAKLGISSTIGETRAQRMAAIGTRGAATLYLNYAGAHALRPAGSDKFNPLNMPRDGHLRACLMAPPGHRMIVADKNAIECRLLNYLAGQTDVVENAFPPAWGPNTLAWHPASSSGRSTRTATRSNGFSARRSSSVQGTGSPGRRYARRCRRAPWAGAQCRPPTSRRNSISTPTARPIGRSLLIGRPATGRCKFCLTAALQRGVRCGWTMAISICRTARSSTTSPCITVRTPRPARMSYGSAGATAPAGSGAASWSRTWCRRWPGRSPPTTLKFCARRCALSYIPMTKSCV